MSRVPARMDSPLARGTRESWKVRDVQAQPCSQATYTLSTDSGRKPSAAAPGEEESDADSDDEGSHAPFQQSGHAADESDDELEYI